MHEKCNILCASLFVQTSKSETLQFIDMKMNTKYTLTYVTRIPNGKGPVIVS